MSQNLPFTLTIAPFPEGFQGDIDETFQQAYQNSTGVVTGNFITGLVLPPNSTLPTTDQGPIAMNETWYFWDTTTGKYLPQTSPYKLSRNYVRNASYQVQQVGPTFTLGAGITQTYDMTLARSTLANVLAIAADVGPAAGADNDLIPSAIKYTVGPTLVPTLAATDLYTHEHLIEGSDLIMVQGQQMSLSFSFFATVAGTYSVYLTNNGRDMSYVANFVITTAQLNAWGRLKIINIPAFPTTGTWNFGDGVTGLYIGIPMGVGSQWQTPTPSTWQAGLRCGTASNINMLTVLNNQLKITGLKLEASPGATYLQVPAFSADYEEVIRYYFTSFNYQSLTAGTAFSFITPAIGQYFVQGLFPRRMCKTPVVTPYSYNTHAAGNLADLSLNIDIPDATIAAVPKGLNELKSGVGLVLNGTFANNATSITGLSSMTGLVVGMLIIGNANIPAGTTVTVINVAASSITISQNTTGAATNVPLTFTFNKADTLAAYIVADARLS